MCVIQSVMLYNLCARSSIGIHYVNPLYSSVGETEVKEGHGGGSWRKIWKSRGQRTVSLDGLQRYYLISKPLLFCCYSILRLAPYWFVFNYRPSIPNLISFNILKTQQYSQYPFNTTKNHFHPATVPIRVRSTSFYPPPSNPKTSRDSAARYGRLS